MIILRRIDKTAHLDSKPKTMIWTEGSQDNPSLTRAIVHNNYL
jgi:hypothetical protein